MMEWYTGLSMELSIFLGIALVASVVLLLLVLLSLLGMGDDISDMEIGDLDQDGLSLLSLRSVTGFFGGFGWAGALALKSGLSFGAALVLGMLAGLSLLVGIAYTMKLLYSLGRSGTIQLHNSIGQIATVYLPIPPDQSGAGKVRVMIQGRLKVLSAFTDSAQRVPSQRKVKVVGLMDEHTLLVTPLEESQAAKGGTQERKV